MRHRVWISILSAMLFVGCPSQPSYEKPTWRDIGAAKDEVAAIGSKTKIYIQLAADLSGDQSLLEDKTKVDSQVATTQSVMTRLGIAAIGTANK